MWGRFEERAVGYQGVTRLSDIDAYHEAGHVVVALMVGARAQHATIEPDRDDGPARYADVTIVWPVDPLSDPVWCQRSIEVALGGPVAEMIYRGEPLHPGLVAEWKADWENAWTAAATIIEQERPRLRHLEKTVGKLYRVLKDDEHWPAVAAVADELLAHEWIEAEQIEDIVNYWIGRRG